MTLQQHVEGLGSVRGVPSLPEGFQDIFDSHLVEIPNGLRLHAVIGGIGPPLLLLSGWPQTWYSWRHAMLPLSRRYTVIAMDARGVNLSDRPETGYDLESLAQDAFNFMTALGHDRFTLMAHDIGMWYGYIMAVDHPERIVKQVFCEAIIPGLFPPIELLPEDRRQSDFLWHFNFNRSHGVNEQLVSGREEIYFGYQFATKAGHPDGLPKAVRDHYIKVLQQPGALRASFEFYRAIDDDIPQVKARRSRRIETPTLLIAADRSCGSMIEQSMVPLGSQIQSLVLKNCGHYPFEEKPEESMAAVESFLAQSP